VQFWHQYTVYRLQKVRWPRYGAWNNWWYGLDDGSKRIRKRFPVSLVPTRLALTRHIADMYCAETGADDEQKNACIEALAWLVLDRAAGVSEERTKPASNLHNRYPGQPQP